MLFLFTLVTAIFSIASVWFVSRRIFTLALFYWVGWLLGLAGAGLSVSLGLARPMLPLGISLIETLHVCAAVGFFLGSFIMAPFSADKFKYKQKGLNLRPPKLNGLLWGILALEAILGLWLLQIRLLDSGFDLYAIRTSFLQENYLTDNLPLPQRLYNFVSLIALIPVIFWGVQDRFHLRPNFGRLVLAFFAAAPGGISTGGRIWVMQTLAAYVIAYLISPGPQIDFKSSLRVWGQIIAAVVALSFLFAVIGQVRDVSRGEGVVRVQENMPPLIANTLQTFSPLYGYLGTPVLAAGLYSDATLIGWEGKLAGEATFPWAYSQALRLGIVSTSRQLDYTRGVRGSVATVDIKMSATHATLIPLLLADFGRDNFALCATLIFAALQLAFGLCLQLGRFWLLPATVFCLNGGFLCFQDASFGTASAVVPIILGLVLYPVVSRTLVWGQNRVLLRTHTS